MGQLKTNQIHVPKKNMFKITVTVISTLEILKLYLYSYDYIVIHGISHNDFRVY